MNTETVPSLSECLAAASDTKAFTVREGALGEIPELIDRFFPDAEAVIVADENTMAAAGSRVLELLKAGNVKTANAFMYPGTPRIHAEYRYVGALVARLKQERDGALLPIAVGSGTVNDIVKRAAAEIGLPYLCVPTAASVDGYTSYGAALLAEGYKKTFECPAPRVVAADSSVLAAAPAYLSSSGFGDLASKIVAGTDWIIAEEAGRAGAPGTEPIDPFAWAMTQTGLRASLARSETAWRGDETAVGELFRALALTGFSMQYLRSSRPVSGCEHLFSHVWEMDDLSVDGVPVTHGHKVAVGTLCATAFTETLFSRVEASGPRKDPRPNLGEREAEVRAAFAAHPATQAVLETAASKLRDRTAAAALVSAMSAGWDALRSKVQERLVPYRELKAMLERAGCPTRPEEIGLSRTEAIATARKAQMIRNRYTVLDLAWDFGMLDAVLAEIEASPIYLR